jgi:hypothetical protein
MPLGTLGGMQGKAEGLRSMNGPAGDFYVLLGLYGGLPGSDSVEIGRGRAEKGDMERRDERACAPGGSRSLPKAPFPLVPGWWRFGLRPTV